MAAAQLGIPGEILDVVDLAPTFTSTTTAEALHGTGITVPEFASYAPRLWRYWAGHLDPDRARRDDPAGPLVGKHVIITAHRVASVAPRRSRSPNAVRRCSRWRATPKRSTN